MGWGRGGWRLKFYYFVGTKVCFFFFFFFFFFFGCVCVCVCVWGGGGRGEVRGAFSRFFLGLTSKTDYLGLPESSVYFYTQGIKEYIK